MKIFNLFIYFLTLFFFFLIFTIFFDLIKNKMIFKKEEKGKSFPYEWGSSSSNDFNVKVDIKFFKLIILFLILNTGVVYLLPWAYKLEKIGFLGLFYGFIFLFILFFAYLYILREKEIE